MKLIELIKEMHNNPAYKEDVATGRIFGDFSIEEKYAHFTRQFSFVSNLVIALQQVEIDIEVGLDSETQSYYMKIEDKVVEGLFFSHLMAILRHEFPHPNELKMVIAPHDGGNPYVAHIPCLKGVVIKPLSHALVAECEMFIPHRTQVSKSDVGVIEILYTHRSPFEHTQGRKLFALGELVTEDLDVSFYDGTNWVPIESCVPFYITPAWRYYYAKN